MPGSAASMPNRRRWALKTWIDIRRRLAASENVHDSANDTSGPQRAQWNVSGGR